MWDLTQLNIYKPKRILQGLKVKNSVTFSNPFLEVYKMKSSSAVAKPTSSGFCTWRSLCYKMNRCTFCPISNSFSFSLTFLSRSFNSSSHLLSVSSAYSIYSFWFLKTSNVFAISCFRFSRFPAKLMFNF